MDTGSLRVARPKMFSLGRRDEETCSIWRVGSRATAGGRTNGHTREAGRGLTPAGGDLQIYFLKFVLCITCTAGASHTHERQTKTFNYLNESFVLLSNLQENLAEEVQNIVTLPSFSGFSGESKILLHQ